MRKNSHSFHWLQVLKKITDCRVYLLAKEQVFLILFKKALMENRSKNYSFWIFKKRAIVFERLKEI